MVELEDLLQATGGLPHGPIHATRFTGLCCDSRQVAPGQLFVAIRSDWADGHDDIPEACRRGALGVLCERPVDPETCSVTCIVVRNTRSALADWARAMVKWGAVEGIGVAGSAGKSTATEAIAAVLEQAGPLLKAPSSAGPLGLAIGLSRLQPGQRLAVVELASEAPGDMAEMMAIHTPRHGVVLNLAAERFRAPGAVDLEALEIERLLESLPADGWAVLNCDDPRVVALVRRTAAKPIWVGVGPRADVRASRLQASEAGLSFTLIARQPLRAGQEESVRVSTRLLGRHNVYALLAAAALGLAYGLSLERIAEALRGLAPLPGRLQPLSGRGGALILDDTQSATPATVEAALEVLAGLPQARKIAVLGDMSPRGAAAQEAYRQAGAKAALATGLLVTVGDGMRLAAQEALRQGLARGQVRVTYTPEDALRALEGQLGPDVAVLVKGAPEMRLGQVVQALAASESGAGERAGGRAGQLDEPRTRPARLTWVEVDLEAIAQNVRRLRGIVGEQVAIMAVVKADGYGHGAIKVAYTALNNGADWLGVACLNEALALRAAGIEAPILILGYTPPWQAQQVVEHGIDATVFNLEPAQALGRAAAALGRTARVHVKVDTGMGRLGLLPEDTVPFVEALAAVPGLAVQGIFTHFAMADSADRSHCNEQWRRFKGLLAELARRGLRPPLAHAANSAATLTMPEAHLDMVRVGVALYGLSPSADVPCPPGFRPALAFKTQVSQVKTVPAGSCVSYGCTYRTARESRLAVIPVGYADGFRRAPQHWGEVLVRGRRAPIVGRVCMDQTIIDVTDIPGVRQGDEVVLIGSQGEERITADEVAARLGTINYEVVSEILARVPRVS